MRISDWSSDVCSSDLLALHPAPGEFAEAHGVEPGRLHQRQIGIPARFGPLFGIPGDPDRDRGAIDISGRSEEHTSELQSLMRISYAVFCLKKKKKTNKQ